MLSRYFSLLYFQTFTNWWWNPGKYEKKYIKHSIAVIFWWLSFYCKGAKTLLCQNHSKKQLENNQFSKHMEHCVYFRIQGKCPTCSKKASYPSNGSEQFIQLHTPVIWFTLLFLQFFYFLSDILSPLGDSRRNLQNFYLKSILEMPSPKCKIHRDDFSKIL